MMQIAPRLIWNKQRHIQPPWTKCTAFDQAESSQSIFVGMFGFVLYCLHAPSPLVHAETQLEQKPLKGCQFATCDNLSRLNVALSYKFHMGLVCLPNWCHQDKVGPKTSSLLGVVDTPSMGPTIHGSEKHSASHGSVHRAYGYCKKQLSIVIGWIKIGCIFKYRDP